MKVRMCDRCKRLLDDEFTHLSEFPKARVQVCKNYSVSIHSETGYESVDLCWRCQAEIYEFIFGDKTE